MMHFIAVIGLPHIMGIWEGHWAPMNPVRKFAVCVDSVHGSTVGHVPRNNSSISCGVATM